MRRMSVTGVAMFTERHLMNRVARVSVLLSLLVIALRSGVGQTITGLSTSGGSQSGSTSIGQPQSPFQGSVPTGQATGTSLALSLKDAFDLALKYNLGVIESDQNIRAARGL